MAARARDLLGRERLGEEALVRQRRLRRERPGAFERAQHLAEQQRLAQLDATRRCDGQGARVRVLPRDLGGQEGRPESLPHRGAQSERVRIGRALRREQPGARERRRRTLRAPRGHPVPVERQTLALAALGLLRHVGARQAIVRALHVGLGHVEVRERERAVAEARVEVPEGGPVLALEPVQTVGPLLHVVDGVAHEQGDVAPARAARVRLGVDPRERGRGVARAAAASAGEQRADKAAGTRSAPSPTALPSLAGRSSPRAPPRSRGGLRPWRGP